MVDTMGDLVKVIAALHWLIVILFPLGLWKLVEIVIWVFK